MPAHLRVEAIVARIVSTLYWPLRESWVARVRMLDRGATTRLGLLWRIVAAIPRADVLVLDGGAGLPSRYVDLIAAAIAVRWPGGGPHVVISECTWKAGRSPLGRRLRRAGLQLVDTPRVTYCVLSDEERERFEAVWGVGHERVVYTPFYFTLSEADLAAPTPDGEGVFAGGDSMRDYGPLVAAARGLPAAVTIASLRLPGVTGGLPANVTAGGVSSGRFFELMRAAAVVVVPMEPGLDRSAGQQTYLNAMALGKLAVVTDGPGVRDCVEDGATGLVVAPGDAGALESALRWALDAANAPAVRAIRDRAREVARADFTPERYVERVLAVVDRVVRAKDQGAPSRSSR